MDDLLLELLPAIKRKARAFHGEIYALIPGGDLTQAAALAALEGIRKAGDRDRETVAGYCMVKAGWSMIDSLRRELVQVDGRVNARSVDVGPTSWCVRYHDTAESAEAHHARWQLVAKACQVADKLPQDQREVLRRLYVDDQGQAEAGEAMGVTQSRISQIHSKAIRALRSALA